MLSPQSGISCLEESNAIQPFPFTHDTFSLKTIVHNPALFQTITSGKARPFFQELARLYRDIYAREPWNEHLVCTGKDCGFKIGIDEEAVLSEQDEKISRNPDDCICPRCASQMDFFYSPQNLIVTLEKAFREKVFASLLCDGSQQILGFSLGWETTAEKGYRDKMVQGEGDGSDPKINYIHYLREFEEYLGRKIEPTMTVFNSAEWAVSPQVRSAKASLPILYAIYSVAQQTMTASSENPIPVIGHTLVGSKALGIFKKIGFHAGEPHGGSDEVRLYSTLPRLLEGTQKYIHK